jgi:decaprenylphospho-beta-D-ribofuranose 2-oxidase
LSIYHAGRSPYWREKRVSKQQIVDWDSYFYPLDALLGWHKIYGRRGFVQFQCVIPLHNAERGLSDLLEEISNARTG